MPAVDDFNLDVADGEFMVLVVPSGSRKTTALRMAAGLEDISDGILCIFGLVWAGYQRGLDQRPRLRRDVPELAPGSFELALFAANWDERMRC
jgi:ABC-type Fe3+/spermidine/putrescine transport system ATPase subunit